MTEAVAGLVRSLLFKLEWHHNSNRYTCRLPSEPQLLHSVTSYRKKKKKHLCIYNGNICFSFSIFLQPLLYDCRAKTSPLPSSRFNVATDQILQEYLARHAISFWVSTSPAWVGWNPLHGDLCPKSLNMRQIKNKKPSIFFGISKVGTL